MNWFSRYSILLFLIFSSFIGALGQIDTTNSKKNGISIGTTTFPFLYNGIGEGLGLGQDPTGGPSLSTQIMEPTQFFCPLNISYKRTLKRNYFFRIGVNLTKPSYFNKDDFFYYSGYIGLQRKLNKSKKKLRTSLTMDLVAGNLRFASFYGTGGLHNLGAIHDGRIKVFGVSPGISMQYYLSRTFFVESEIMLLGYWGIVNGFVYDSSYPNDQMPISLFAYGIVFERLIGLNIGYNF